MKTIVLTGGGTAGHVMPNLALLPHLKKHFEKVYYIGTDGVEKQIIKNAGLAFYQIEATKLHRKSFFKNIKLPFKFLSSIKQSKKILKQLNPSVVFSKGGFVSLPVVIACKKLKIPVISHESDLSFGLANKIILRYANKVITSFQPTAEKNKKCVFAGSPIRPEIFEGNKQTALKATNFAKQQKTILFFGGSLGAQAINNTLVKALPTLVQNYNIVHITGKGNKTNFSHSAYCQVEFSNQIQHFFALADLVVCRAGANSLFELLALNKNMLLIPLSKKASRGDQIENAKYFKNKGWANVIFEENLNKNSLIKEIEKSFNSNNQVKATKTFDPAKTNQKIVEIIVSHAK